MPQYKDKARSTYKLANVRNRPAASRSANRHLTRVKYGDEQSVLIQPDTTQLSWLFEVVCDHGEDLSQPAIADIFLICGFTAS